MFSFSQYTVVPQECVVVVPESSPMNLVSSQLSLPPVLTLHCGAGTPCDFVAPLRSDELHHLSNFCVLFPFYATDVLVRMWSANGHGRCHEHRKG